MDKLLTAAEVADLIGVDPQLLADWRSRKVGPPFLKLGHRTVRYDPAALERWLRAQQKPTNENRPPSRTATFQYIQGDPTSTYTINQGG